MICRSCGALIKDSAVRCPHCKLEDPDLYRGRKESDYDALRSTGVQYPDHPAYRTASSVRPADAHLPRPEDPPVTYPKENRVTIAELDRKKAPKEVLRPLSGRLPNPRQVENKGKSIAWTVITWIFAIVMFFISFEGCDAFFA